MNTDPFFREVLESHDFRSSDTAASNKASLYV